MFQWFSAHCFDLKAPNLSCSVSLTANDDLKTEIETFSAPPVYLCGVYVGVSNTPDVWKQETTVRIPLWSRNPDRSATKRRSETRLVVVCSQLFYLGCYNSPSSPNLDFIFLWKITTIPADVNRNGSKMTKTPLQILDPGSDCVCVHVCCRGHRKCITFFREHRTSAASLYSFSLSLPESLRPPWAPSRCLSVSLHLHRSCFPQDWANPLIRIRSK